MGTVDLGGVAPEIVLPGQLEGQFLILPVISSHIDGEAVGGLKPHGRQLALFRLLALPLRLQIALGLELLAEGYLRQEGKRKQPRKGKLPPMRFESTDGYPIYVGRNNRQNDELTFKLARKDDIWCHASKVHGSHVIISCGGQKPPDDTVTQAAQLASFFSESGSGQIIPVDVTRVREVKRIPSGKPGMVIYHTYRTAIVNPYGEIVVDALNAEKKPEA